MQDDLSTMRREPSALPGNGFAIASLVFGILALISTMTMTIVIPVFFGSLAIILGFLSRGNRTSLHHYALTAVITGCCSLVINVALFAGSFYMIFSNKEMAQQYWNMMNETYEQMTGMTLEELLQNYGLGTDTPISTTQR